MLYKPQACNGFRAVDFAPLTAMIGHAVRSSVLTAVSWLNRWCSVEIDSRELDRGCSDRSTAAVGASLICQSDSVLRNCIEVETPVIVPWV